MREEQPTHSLSHHSLYDDSDEYVETESFIARTLQHRDTIRTAVLPSGPEDISFALTPVNEKTEAEEDGMPPVDIMDMDDNIVLSDSEEEKGRKEEEGRQGKESQEKEKEDGREDDEKPNRKETTNHMDIESQPDSPSMLNTIGISTPNEQSTILAAYPPSHSAIPANMITNPIF